MARLRSDQKRSAIVAAAIREIASDGLGAATATIAKEAGVSNGALFTYFETKADLLSYLYLELKTEMAAAALDGIAADTSIREQTFHMWCNWLKWATSFPEKRRTLAHLIVMDDITPESRLGASRAFAGIADILERSRANGPMRDAPLEFVAALMNALAETAMDFMIRDPANADEHCAAAFNAAWRMFG
jgi:AcrR family transcriptional regulator